MNEAGRKLFDAGRKYLPRERFHPAFKQKRARDSPPHVNENLRCIVNAEGTPRGVVAPRVETIEAAPLVNGRNSSPPPRWHYWFFCQYLPLDLYFAFVVRFPLTGEGRILLSVSLFLFFFFSNGSWKRTNLNGRSDDSIEFSRFANKKSKSNWNCSSLLFHNARYFYTNFERSFSKSRNFRLEAKTSLSKRTKFSYVYSALTSHSKDRSIDFLRLRRSKTRAPLSLVFEIFEIVCNIPMHNFNPSAHPPETF